MLNLTDVKFRKEPQKYTKLQYLGEKNNITNRKTQKMYDYYVCDYCSREIKINVKQEERKGGIATLPHSLTKCGDLKVALHNKCLNKAIEEIENEQRRD